MEHSVIPGYRVTLYCQASFAENLGPLSGISAGRSKQPPEILGKISRFLLAFSFFIRYNLCPCNSTLRSCHGFRSFCCEGPA